MDDKFNGDVDIIFEYSSFPPAKITAFSHFFVAPISLAVSAAPFPLPPNRFQISTEQKREKIITMKIKINNECRI